MDGAEFVNALEGALELAAQRARERLAEDRRNLELLKVYVTNALKEASGN